MTALNCSVYHKFIEALVHEEGHHAKLSQRTKICTIKHLLLQVRDMRQMIFNFRVLLRTADAHMNHRAESLTDCK